MSWTILAAPWSWQGALRAAEQELLGLARPSPAEAFAACAWSPEDAAGWCARCGGTLVRPGPTSAAVVHGCPRCAAGSARGRRVRMGPSRATGRQPALGDRVVRLGRYAPPLSGWVLSVKHGRWCEMGLSLGQALGRSLLAAGSGDPIMPTVIVPAPMPWLRRVERGIDHAAVIAAGVGMAMEAPVIPLLARRHEVPQARRSSAGRRRLGGVGVWVRQRWLERACGRVGMSRCRWGDAGLSGHRVVLVDDVRTTGATALACVRALSGLRPRQVVVAVVAVRD